MCLMRRKPPHFALGARRRASGASKFGPKWVEKKTKRCATDGVERRGRLTSEGGARTRRGASRGSPPHAPMPSPQRRAWRDQRAPRAAAWARACLAAALLLLSSPGPRTALCAAKGWRTLFAWGDNRHGEAGWGALPYAADVPLEPSCAPLKADTLSWLELQNGAQVQTNARPRAPAPTTALRAALCRWTRWALCRYALPRRRSSPPCRAWRARTRLPLQTESLTRGPTALLVAPSALLLRATLRRGVCHVAPRCNLHRFLFSSLTPCADRPHRGWAGPLAGTIGRGARMGVGAQ